jgi:hypothetical protein
MRPYRALGLLPVLLAALALALAPACSEEPRATVLQELDFKPLEGLEVPFDRNQLLDTESFTDHEGLEVATIQRLLQKTPYFQPSFLETYQSNGVRAADAIARAARTYRINPLVFVVFAQITQGLVGERRYPFPPHRVEYVFRCGCLADRDCLPELAGFDRQVDCLGRSLRVALDEVSAYGETASGWGLDKTSTTLDGLKVTPASEATAAIYDRIPVVAEGKDGGAWVFWNVWHLYAQEVDYFGPFGGIYDGSWIGDPCDVDGNCGYDNPICAENYQDGMCTTACDGDCPSDPDLPEAYCVAFPDQGFCFTICNPGAPACREGYACTRVRRFNGSGEEDSRHVCYPIDTGQ